MNIQQLKYVIEVERCRSIKQAARNLFISQPSISAAIKDLEKSLDITIFTRSTTGVSVTDVGAAFILDAKRIVAEMEELGKKYKEQPTGPAVKLSVAAYPKDSVTHSAISLVEQCRKEKISLDLYVYCASMPKAIADVQKGEADLAVISYYNIFNNVNREMLLSEDIEFHFLAEYEIRAAVDKKHPLAQKKPGSLREILQYPCIEAGTSVYEYLLEVSRVAGERVSHAFTQAEMQHINTRTDNQDLIYHLLEKGEAFTFVSYYEGIENYWKENFYIIDIPLWDLKEVRGWIKRKDRRLTRHQKSFVDHLEGYFKTHK